MNCAYCKFNFKAKMNLFLLSNKIICRCGRLLKDKSSSNEEIGKFICFEQFGLYISGYEKIDHLISNINFPIFYNGKKISNHFDESDYVYLNRDFGDDYPGY